MEKKISQEAEEALGRAIALYPTLRVFAGLLGVRYQVVQQWLVNGIPAEYCPQIEKLSNGISRCEDLNNKVNWAYLRANPELPAPQATTEKASA